jgi:hypothetical protein
LPRQEEKRSMKQKTNWRRSTARGQVGARANRSAHFQP